jgi:hypothetical protein
VLSNLIYMQAPARIGSAAAGGGGALPFVYGTQLSRMLPSSCVFIIVTCMQFHARFVAGDSSNRRFAPRVSAALRNIRARVL